MSVPCGVWLAPDARVGDGDRLDFLIVILTLALAGVVVLVVGAPVRRGRRAGRAVGGVGAMTQRADGGEARAFYQPEELESAREAKYREIRDAELDYRTGKLSREDYDAIDADLRAEAIDILNRLKPADPQAPAADPAGRFGGARPGAGESAQS